MNINFIRNLSDEILRENQQLKSDIIRNRQHLLNFQESMIKMITSIYPNVLLLETPEQTLNTFIETVKQKLDDYNKKRNQVNQAVEQISFLNRTANLLQSEIRMKEQFLLKKQKQLSQQRNLIDQFQKKAEEERKSIKMANQSLSSELKKLKEKVKIDKLLQEQLERNERQEIRQHNHKQLLEFRQKSERQLIFMEKQLRSELNDKQKTIKSLQKIIEKLSQNAKLQSSESESLIKILKSFQQYNNLSKIINDQRQDLSKLRQNNQDLQTEILKMQSSIQQLQTNDKNLSSQIQRLQIQKGQIESALQQKKLELEKSQKDKDAIQLYFNNRWNKEYSRVKVQLQKSYIERFKKVESECKEKIQLMGQQMQKAIRINQQTQKINQLLVQDNKKKQRQVKKCFDDIKQLKIEIIEAAKSNKQLWFMSRQELNSLNMRCDERLSEQNKKIFDLEFEVRLGSDVLDGIRKQYIQQIDSISKDHLMKIYQLKSQFEVEKSEIDGHYQKIIKLLKDDIQLKSSTNQELRQEIRKEFEVQLTLVKKQMEIKVKEKEEQTLKKCDRWLVKSKQTQTKFNQLKKKNDQNDLNYQKDKYELERTVQKLKQNQGKYQGQIKSNLLYKNELIIKLNDQARNCIELEALIETKEKQKQQLRGNLQKYLRIIEQYKENRNLWEKDLEDTQKMFKEQFHHLKVINQRQINLYKSKVWELEEIARKRPMKKKDYDKIKQLDHQRRLLKNQINIKEAENIILHQVRDYYQTKLRKDEKIEQEPKAMQTFFNNRKIKMIRNESVKLSTAQVHNQSKEVIDMRKYIGQSTKRYRKYNLTKNIEDRYTRINTTTND